MRKDVILQAVQSKTPLDYETVEKVYKITGSYDAVLYLSETALRFNKDIVELASFLYGNSGRIYA